MNAIFKACRIYLQVFDVETALISEACEAKKILEEGLEIPPLSCFSDPPEQHRTELLEVFRNRKEAAITGRKRLKVTLMSDLNTTAALLDPYRTPRDPIFFIDR